MGSHSEMGYERELQAAFSFPEITDALTICQRHQAGL